MIDQVELSMRKLQKDIQEALLNIECNYKDNLDNLSCRAMNWIYPSDKGEGGGDRNLIIGNIFEKAAVNFSNIKGNSLPQSAKQSRENIVGDSFHAIGVSVIVHPRNPYVPTSHMNVRFFCTYSNEKIQSWWFGGGFDLTPYYGFKEDAINWHTSAKKICDKHQQDYFKYKEACDEYFCIRHRNNERRGIGGIFFDDLNDDFEKCFAFVKDVGKGFIEAYIPIVNKRYMCPYGERERTFQLYRRSRYVEFNLIYDRGVRFGLQSGGNVHAIFSSLPPQAAWLDEPFDIPQGSPEHKLYTDFLVKRDWINESPFDGQRSDSTSSISC